MPATESVAAMHRLLQALADPDRASWPRLVGPATADQSGAPTLVAGPASAELRGYFPRATWPGSLDVPCPPPHSPSRPLALLSSPLPPPRPGENQKAQELLPSTTGQK